VFSSFHTDSHQAFDHSKPQLKLAPHASATLDPTTMRHAGSIKYLNAGTCSISQDRPTSKTGKMSSEAIVNIDIQGRLPKVASGKVRDLYAIDDETLLFVASDRISAYDVIMENVSQVDDGTLLPQGWNLKYNKKKSHPEDLTTTLGHTRQRCAFDIHVQVLVHVSAHPGSSSENTLPHLFSAPFPFRLFLTSRPLHASPAPPHHSH
jgi:hypothetical protein